MKQLLKSGALITLNLLILSSLNAQKIEKLLSNQKTDKAIEYCENKLEGEEQLSGYTVIADYFFDSNKTQLAAKYYEKAQNKEGYKKVADVYFSNEILDSAEMFYKKADLNVGILKIITFYIKKKDFDKAKIVTDNLKTDEGYIALGDAYLSIDKRFEAADYYEKANYKEGYTKLGNICFQGKSYKQALNYYKKAKNDELVKKCYGKMADESIEEKNYTLALEFFEKAGCKPFHAMKVIADAQFKDEEYISSHLMHLMSCAVAEDSAKSYNETAQIYANKSIEYVKKSYESYLESVKLDKISKENGDVLTGSQFRALMTHLQNMIDYTKISKELWDYAFKFYEKCDCNKEIADLKTEINGYFVKMEVDKPF